MDLGHMNVFVCWKCIEDAEFCLEVIDLYVDIECMFSNFYLIIIFFGPLFRTLPVNTLYSSSSSSLLSTLKVATRKKVGGSTVTGKPRLK